MNACSKADLIRGTDDGRFDWLIVSCLMLVWEAMNLSSANGACGRALWVVNVLTAEAWPFKSDVLRQKYTPLSCRGDIWTHIVSHSRSFTMSCDQCYPLPQVYLVDGGGGTQRSGQPPNLVPCWSFPPAQERVRSHQKSRGFMGVSPCLALVVMLLFLLVFGALGFEAYQIYNMQTELREMRQVRSKWMWTWKKPERRHRRHSNSELLLMLLG